MRVLLNDKCELLKCNEGGNELLMWGKIWWKWLINDCEKGQILWKIKEMENWSSVLAPVS